MGMMANNEVGSVSFPWDASWHACHISQERVTSIMPESNEMFRSFMSRKRHGLFPPLEFQVKHTGTCSALPRADRIMRA
jgi:hypothetical protein